MFSNLREPEVLSHISFTCSYLLLPDFLSSSFPTRLSSTLYYLYDLEITLP